MDNHQKNRLSNAVWALVKQLSLIRKSTILVQVKESGNLVINLIPPPDEKDKEDKDDGR